MGFSVSGSAAIIFVATFIGFGMFYSATANSMELVNDARDDHSERLLEQKNTEVRLTDVKYDSAKDTLNLTVVNTGSNELHVSDVDVLVDNSYQSGYRTAVDDVESTDLWLADQRLEVNITGQTTQPNTVKVVTGPGIAETGTPRVV